MMNDIKVSVIILTYNHARYVRQAIESVIDQKVSFPMEIIIADDKSSDQTQSILEEFQTKYPDLIKLVLRQENVGTTVNICDAFRKSKGEYLIGFGGDDYWIDSNKLQIQVSWLDNHHDYIGVSHVIEARNDDGLVSGSSPHLRLRGKTASSELFLKAFYFPTSATLFRNIFKSEKAENYVKLITRSRLVEDVSLTMILLDAGKVHILDRCMAVYRSNSNNGSLNYNSLRNPIQNFKDHIDIYSANEDYFSGKYDFSRLNALKSHYPFIWSLKNHKMKLFLELFKKMPSKAKIISIVTFPKFLITAALQKYKKVISS